MDCTVQERKLYFMFLFSFEKANAYYKGTVSGSGTGPLDYRATGPVPDP